MVSLVIVASLAIGIGANTAIFSVVNALVLKPLPYPDPDRLAVLWLRSPGINIPQDWPSPGQYIDIRTENSSFDEMSISQGRTATLHRTRSARAGRSAPHDLEPVPPPRRAAGSRPAARRRRRRAGPTAGRDSQPRLLAPAVRCRPQRGRHDDHAQRARPRHRGRAQPVHGCRRPDRDLPSERRSHADSGQHPADGRVRSAAAWPGRSQPARRRELQRHGTAQGRRQHGAGASRCQRHGRAHPREGQARQDVHHQRRAAPRPGGRQRAPRGDGAVRVGGIWSSSSRAPTSPTCC